MMKKIINKFKNAKDKKEIDKIIEENLDKMNNGMFFNELKKILAYDKYLYIVQKHADFMISPKDKENANTIIKLCELHNNDKNKLKDYIDNLNINDSLIKLLFDSVKYSTNDVIYVSLIFLNIANMILQILCKKRDCKDYYYHLYSQYFLCFLYLKRYNKAKQNLIEAMKIKKSEELLLNLANIYFYSGKYIKTVKYLTRLLKNNLIRNNYNKISAYLNIFNSYSELEEFDSAIKNLDEAYNALKLLNKDMEYWHYLSKIYGSYARIYGLKGQYTLEREYLIKSLIESKKCFISYPNIYFTTISNLVSLYLNQGKLNKAKFYLGIFRNRVNNQDFFEMTYANLKIELFIKEKDLNGALAICEKYYEKFLLNFKNDHEFLHFIQDYIYINIKINKLDIAWQLTILMEEIAKTNNNHFFIAYSFAYFGVILILNNKYCIGYAYVFKFFRKVNSLKKRFNENSDLFFYSSRFEWINRTIMTLTIKQNNHKLLFIILQYVKNSTLQFFNKKIVSIYRLQKSLDEKEYYLDYYISKDLCFVLGISSVEIKYVKLNIHEEELKKLYDKYQEVLIKSRVKLYDDFNKLDFSKILIPVCDKYKTLIISRSSYLNDIPFAIMGFKNKLLIEKFAISYVGNPLNLTNNTSSKKDTLGLFLSNSIKDTNVVKSNFDKEKEILEKNFSAKSIDIDKTNIDIDYLHIIAHGSFNMKNPLNSHIVVSKNNQDKKIYINEFFKNLKFNPEFIFFSACSSGRTARLKGNEMLGFISFINLHKINSAVFTSWDILSNFQTIDIVKDFYNFWLNKKYTKPKALQKAMLKNKSDNLYDWAGFVLYGK